MEEQIEYFVVRVDAVNDIPGGSFVTVESGPHAGLAESLAVLRSDRQRAYVQPDIIFLPREAECWALNEPVAQKPRLLVSAATVARARRGALPGDRARQGLRAPPNPAALAAPGLARRAAPADVSPPAGVRSPDRADAGVSLGALQAAAPALQRGPLQQLVAASPAPVHRLQDFHQAYAQQEGLRRGQEWRQERPGQQPVQQQLTGRQTKPTRPAEEPKSSEEKGPTSSAGETL